MSGEVKIIKPPRYKKNLVLGVGHACGFDRA